MHPENRSNNPRIVPPPARLNLNEQVGTANYADVRGWPRVVFLFVRTKTSRNSDDHKMTTSSPSALSAKSGFAWLRPDTSAVLQFQFSGSTRPQQPRPSGNRSIRSAPLACWFFRRMLGPEIGVEQPQIDTDAHRYKMLPVILPTPENERSGGGQISTTRPASVLICVHPWLQRPNSG